MLRFLDWSLANRSALMHLHNGVYIQRVQDNIAKNIQPTSCAAGVVFGTGGGKVMQFLVIGSTTGVHL